MPVTDDQWEAIEAMARGVTSTLSTRRSSMSTTSKRMPAPLEAVGGARDVAEPRHHEARPSCDTRRLSPSGTSRSNFAVTSSIGAEPSTSHEPSARATNDPSASLASAGMRAHEPLEQIADRDQTFDGAELVHHDGQVPVSTRGTLRAA